MAYYLVTKGASYENGLLKRIVKANALYKYKNYKLVGNVIIFNQSDSWFGKAWKSVDLQQK